MLTHGTNPYQVTKLTTATATPETTREIIQAAYDKEAAYTKVGQAIRAWIITNEGKKLTKRNKPELIAAATAAWNGTDEVRIWPGYVGLEIYSSDYKRTDCKQGFIFYLGGGDCPIVSIDYFDERNTPLSAAIEKRQPRRLADLASTTPEEIDALVADYLRARQVLADRLDSLEESYGVRRQLGSRRYTGLEMDA